MDGDRFDLIARGLAAGHTRRGVHAGRRLLLGHPPHAGVLLRSRAVYGRYLRLPAISVVRGLGDHGLLVAVTMRLMGRWNWWAPS
jgi:hypothetical protein